MPMFHNWKKDFQGRRVLVIGDVMLDQYVLGTVERISPEAPVPIVLEQRREWRLGGAANVAANIRGIGGIPHMLSIIGDDDAGQRLRHHLETHHIDGQLLLTSNHRPTTIKTRIIGNHQQMLRLDNETTTPLNPQDETTLIEAALDLLDHTEAVLFEDYDKGVITPRIYTTVAKAARQKDIPILIDPKLRNFRHYQHATLFKPNLKELRDGLGIDINTTQLDIQQVKDATQRLREMLQPVIAMITLSEHGIYATDYEEEYHVPAFLQEVADVSGAGDTTIAVTTLALLAGYPLKETIVLANAAAAAVCAHPGVVPLDEQLMEEAIQIIKKSSTDGI